MCNLYQMTPKGSVELAIGQAGRVLLGADWELTTVGPFQQEVLLLPVGTNGLTSVVGQWGLIRPGQPTRKPEKRYQTNNARIESIAEKPPEGAQCVGTRRLELEPLVQRSLCSFIFCGAKHQIRREQRREDDQDFPPSQTH